jgi:Fibronectin type III domain
VQTAGSSSPPGSPQNVTGSADTSRDIKLVWDPPVSGEPVDHYQIVQIDNGQPSGAVGTTTGTSFTLTGLRDCSLYQYGVIAVGADGQASSPGVMTGKVITQGPPDNPPPVVTILALGVATHISAGSFNPVSANDYCTTRDGSNLNGGLTAQATLRDMASQWIGTPGPAHMAGYGADSNLVEPSLVLAIFPTGAGIEPRQDHGQDCLLVWVLLAVLTSAAPNA